MTSPKQKFFNFFIAPALVVLQVFFLMPATTNAAPSLPFAVQGQVFLNGTPADGATVTLTNARTNETLTSTVGGPSVVSGWYHFDLGNMVTPGSAGDRINIVATMNGLSANTYFVYNPAAAYSNPAILYISSSSSTSTPGTPVMSITPTNATIAVSGTRQFTAIAINGGGQPMSNTISWSSLNPAIASVNATGLVSGVASGTTKIQASNNLVSSTADIFVLGSTTTPTPTTTPTSTPTPTTTPTSTPTPTTTPTTTIPVLSITTQGLPSGNVGSPYFQYIYVSSTAAFDTLNWSITSGTLPVGLVLNSTTGLISGTPTTAGTSTFTVRVGNNASSTPISSTFNLLVTAFGTIPVVSTSPATGLTQTGATLNGNIISTGNMTIASSGFRYGTSTDYGLFAYPMASSTPTTIGKFSATVTGLVANVPYHYQAFASNASGTAYGLDQIFRSPLICNANFSVVLLDGNYVGPSQINIESTAGQCYGDLKNIINASTTPMRATLLGDLLVSRIIQDGELQLFIPAGTYVTPSNASTTGTSTWNGQIQLPRISTSTANKAPTSTGYTNTINTLVEVGGNVDLTLSQPVKLIIPGQAANRRVFYTNSQGSFDISPCTSTSGTINNLGANQKECYFYEGTNLAVWTTHFSTFGTYTSTAVSSGGSSSSGSSSSGSSSATKGLSPQPFSTPIDKLSLKINAGAAVAHSPSVTLALEGGSEAKKMAISNSTDFSNASQIDYATTANWMLSAGNGTKTVYAKFYNSWGNASPVVSSTINLQTSVIDNDELAPISKVLRKFPNGTLIKLENSNKVYVIYNNTIKHILNLKELKKYRGRRIHNATQEEWEQYKLTSFDPSSRLVVSYSDGLLVRDTATKKIYVVNHGQLVYIPSLQELKKYIGKKMINTNSGVLAKYTF